MFDSQLGATQPRRLSAHTTQARGINVIIYILFCPLKHINKNRLL